jgi:hypothetical protein
MLLLALSWVRQDHDLPALSSPIFPLLTSTAFGKNTTPGDEAETGCGKCKKDAKRDVYVTGTVPLTAQILSVRPSPPSPRH